MNTSSPNAKTETKPRFVYFVAIQYHDGNGIGFTNMEIPLHVQLTSLARVQEIEQYLRTHGYPSTCVMGFSLLRTETVPARGRS